MNAIQEGFAMLPTDQYSVPRDTAERLNPLISSSCVDTLGLVADVLVFCAEGAPGLASPEGQQGLGLVLEAVRQAVKYEAFALEALAEERRAARAGR
ncbi:hypothetical protein [Parvibaculum sp.]|uniref:hypothetical protein n=1 Tax=Parvibaculum sp. TaxID=2024848 RepID=UPI001D32D580|nr:hypothetical protein [Parvibaculum sp.]MBX3488884.1 hypothetical protein [Parvibaculum sp.]